MNEAKAREIPFERERTAALRAHAVAHLNDPDLALTRLTRGTYGTCTTCGGPVGAERLRVLPVTESCTACAGRPRSPLMSQL